MWPLEQFVIFGYSQSYGTYFSVGSGSRISSLRTVNTLGRVKKLVECEIIIAHVMKLVWSWTTHILSFLYRVQRFQLHCMSVPPIGVQHNSSKQKNSRCDDYENQTSLLSSDFMVKSVPSDRFNIFSVNSISDNWTLSAHAFLLHARQNSLPSLQMIIESLIIYMNMCGKTSSQSNSFETVRWYSQCMDKNRKTRRYIMHFLWDMEVLILRNISCNHLNL